MFVLLKAEAVKRVLSVQSGWQAWLMSLFLLYYPPGKHNTHSLPSAFESKIFSGGRGAENGAVQGDYGNVFFVPVINTKIFKFHQGCS